MHHEQSLDYYRSPGPITQLPAPVAAALDGLPDDIPALVRKLQGLVLHAF